MATANLLEPHVDPVMASVRVAFEMVEAAGAIRPAGRSAAASTSARSWRAWSARSKFSFDLWGDTVNLAHRLSSLGDEPAIHLSATAWARVAGRVSGNSLGEIAVKGKGNVEVVRCLSIES